MAGLGDLLRRGCTYQRVVLSPQVKLHLITRESFPSFSVLVSSDFGACNRAWLDENGREGALPEGIAHLTEHLLLFRSMRTELIPLAQEFFGQVNGQVDHARSVWWVSNGAYDEASPAASIGQAVARLLRVISIGTPEPDIESLLERARSDVKLEIVHRSQSELPVSTELMANLFPRHPLGSSPLGTVASIDEVELRSQRAALALLGSRLDTIVVLVDRPIPDLAVVVGSAAVESGALEVPTHPPRPSRLPAVERLPPRRASRLHPSATAKVAAGFAVEPLAVASGDRRECARMLLAAELLRSHLPRPIGCVLTPAARVYMARSTLPEPWLINRDARLQSGVEERLRKWRARFEVETKMAVLRMWETGPALVRLCHLAACHGFSLEEMFDAAGGLSAEHPERMGAELDSPLRQAQVYFGPEELLDL
jgi:hypothetical protein